MKNKKASGALVCALVMTLAAAAYGFAGTRASEDSLEATIISVGSGETETVKKIQTRLKSWGYYSGSVDGVFGAKTEAAVKSFQRTNGLSADGKVGEQTAKAIGISLPSGSSGGQQPSQGSSGNSGGNKANEDDVMLLAKCINGEARGEPYNGQVAVGAVILNRVADAEFPNSISGVIYQSGAFDAVKDGQVNLSPSDSCVRAARDAMAGVDPSGGALYYYNPVTATNQWIRSRTIIARIGNHVFCK